MVIQEAPNGRIVVLYINNNPREIVLIWGAIISHNLGKNFNISHIKT